MVPRGGRRRRGIVRSPQIPFLACLASHFGVMLNYVAMTAPTGEFLGIGLMGMLVVIPPFGVRVETQRGQALLLGANTAAIITFGSYTESIG